MAELNETVNAAYERGGYTEILSIASTRSAETTQRFSNLLADRGEEWLGVMQQIYSKRGQGLVSAESLAGGGLSADEIRQL